MQQSYSVATKLLDHSVKQLEDGYYYAKINVSGRYISGTDKTKFGAIGIALQNLGLAYADGEVDLDGVIIGVIFC